MSPRTLGRVLGWYAGILLVVCLLVRSCATLRPLAAPDVHDGERAVADAPLSLADALLPWSLVAGRDGIRADLGGKTAWLTTAQLRRARAYDTFTTLFDPSLGVGTHPAPVVHLLAEQLGALPHDVQTRAQARRVRFEPETPPPEVRLDRATVEHAMHEAASYLARGVDERGRFRYLVDVPTGLTVGGYNWPRHAGTTYFLAQAAGYFPDEPELAAACLRAAARLRDEEIGECGAERCVGKDSSDVDLGSSALAVIAFAELVTSGLDSSYRRTVRELASFLRSQQRPDGELMHLYDRAKRRAVDTQFLYTTGETALALSRAHRVTGDPRDLAAASRALAYTAGPGWRFFGSRYLFAEEHWSCQATADLWDRAPDAQALDFCLRWHAFNRRLQVAAGESPFGDEADGAFAFGPLLTPRTTPASSRGEAAAAALTVATRDAALTAELDGALSFVLREQLRLDVAGAGRLSPALAGAVPGSSVDPQIRMDYVQHAGSMMVRWLALYPDRR